MHTLYASFIPSVKIQNKRVLRQEIGQILEQMSENMKVQGWTLYVANSGVNQSQENRVSRFGERGFSPLPDG